MKTSDVVREWKDLLGKAKDVRKTEHEAAKRARENMPAEKDLREKKGKKASKKVPASRKRTGRKSTSGRKLAMSKKSRRLLNATVSRYFLRKRK